MTWSDFIKIIGGTTVVVAAIAWVAQSLVAHVLAREIEHVKVALARVERLEADLLKSRGEAYGQIWRLTSSLNLFGPITQVDNSELSLQLKNWYFERGWGTDLGIKATVLPGAGRSRIPQASVDRLQTPGRRAIVR